MKTLKILFAAIIFVGFTNAGFANETTDEDATIGVRAEIFSQLELAGVDDVDFGSVARNVTPILDANEGNHQFVGVGHGLGLYELTADNTASVQVTFDEFITLTQEEPGTDGTELRYTPSIYYTLNLAASFGENVITSGGLMSTSNGDEDGEEANRANFIVGGTLQNAVGDGPIPANADTGEYTGEFTLTVIYN